MTRILERYTVPKEGGGTIPMRYVSRVDWSNLRVRFWDRHFGILTPWGNLLACPWERRLFSYRYGYRKCLHIFGLCIYWVWLKRSERDS